LSDTFDLTFPAVCTFIVLTIFGIVTGEETEDFDTDRSLVLCILPSFERRNFDIKIGHEILDMEAYITVFGIDAIETEMETLMGIRFFVLGTPGINTKFFLHKEKETDSIFFSNHCSC